MKTITKKYPGVVVRKSSQTGWVWRRYWLVVNLDNFAFLVTVAVGAEEYAACREGTRLQVPMYSDDGRNWYAYAS